MEQDRSEVMDMEQGSGMDMGRSLDDPSIYINREISWLKFNRRILEEAMGDHPLLEQVKFLAICGSNLDEFYMARVPGLYRQAEKGALEPSPDGIDPQTLLDLIKEEADRLNAEYAEIWEERLLPDLARAGIHIHRMEDLSDEQRTGLREYFERDLFPILTPMAIDAGHPFPFISGLAINIAAMIRDGSGHEHMARIKVPSGLFPRFVSIGGRSAGGQEIHMVPMEDLVLANLDLLFTGLEVVSAYPFRVTRDAEIEIELDDTSDLLTAVEEPLDLVYRTSSRRWRRAWSRDASESQRDWRCRRTCLTEWPPSWHPSSVCLWTWCTGPPPPWAWSTCGSFMTSGGRTCSMRPSFPTLLGSLATRTPSWTMSAVGTSCCITPMIRSSRWWP